MSNLKYAMLKGLVTFVIIIIAFILPRLFSVLVGQDVSVLFLISGMFASKALDIAYKILYNANKAYTDSLNNSK